MRVGPEMKMNVKKKRVSERDADNSNGVCDTEQCGPGIEAEIEKAMERDHQVAGVPTAHRECEQRKEALDAA